MPIYYCTFLQVGNLGGASPRPKPTCQPPWALPGRLWEITHFHTIWAVCHIQFCVVVELRSPFPAAVGRSVVFSIQRPPAFLGMWQHPYSKPVAAVKSPSLLGISPTSLSAFSSFEDIYVMTLQPAQPNQDYLPFEGQLKQVKVEQLCSSFTAMAFPSEGPSSPSMVPLL